MCGADHVFKVADPAAVAIFLTLGFLVLEVLAQVAEGTGALYLLDKLGHKLVTAVS